MTETDAQVIAERYLDELQLEMSHGTLALMNDRTREEEFGWVFFYQTREYLENRNPLAMLAGNAPIIVDRRDGSVHETGTALPVDEYVNAFRREWRARATNE